MKVLIVDDSVLIRERLTASLSGANDVQIIGQVTNAGDAIQFIEENIVDTVILDIRLPDNSGLYVLEKIKGLKPEIKVIMFTNYPFPQYMKKSEELGADYFLHKINEFGKIPELLKKMSTANH